MEDIKFHVFNDNDNNTVQQNEEDGHPKVMEVAVVKEPTHTAMESKLVSTTTMEMVNLDHTKEFQECMDSYAICNGVASFNTIALAIAFYELTCNIHLVVTKSSENNYQQYSCKQHLGCNFHISFGQHHGTGLLHMEKCHFVPNGYITETIAKGGRELEKRRKGQLQQSYLLASLTHRSSPRPGDIQITAGNYEGEDITYNTCWRKLQEVKQVTRKVAEKAFELVIPFLEEWNENNPQSMVEWLVDDQKCIPQVYVCPAYTDKVLLYMDPVISVDAAHLKLAYKGTIFIYSGLTGNDEAYILAFGISGGNEDYQTWNTFNKIVYNGLSICVISGGWPFIFKVCVCI